MPRKASGELKIDRFTETLKDGRIYVYERTRKYNREKKYNQNLGTKLLGILNQGSADIYDDRNILPTRPKRKNMERPAEASKKRTGMIDIISHFSKISDVDREVYAALPDEEGIAQKLLTCVWSCFASDGDTWPKIRAWTTKYAGLLPYRHGIMTKDMYHDLFMELGRREEVKQSIFRARTESLENDAILALDSSTFFTESGNLAAGRKAPHKDKQIKNVYKVLYFYSLTNRRPIAYSLLPGNIPDADTVPNALVQLDTLRLKQIELIADNGYCTEDTIAQLYLKDQHFITRIEASTRWVSKYIEEYRDTLEHGGQMVGCDPLFSGIKLNTGHTFVRRSDGKAVERDVNVFIYYSSVNKSKDDVYFRETFGRYEHSLLNGTALCDERSTIEEFVSKYMMIETDTMGNITRISENIENYKKHMKYNGYLVLIADKENDLDAALRKFREREYIEEDIKNYKGHTGGKKPRVWDDDTLDGQILTQFLALSLHESMETKISYLKDTLAKPSGEADHDKATILKKERQLYNWLFKNSIHDILDWFDAIVTIKVSNNEVTTKWVTETTGRDKMFLEKIGMHPADKKDGDGSEDAIFPD